MKVGVVGYRQWARRIFVNLYAQNSPKWQIAQEGAEYRDTDVILFYGWSKMIPPEVYRNKLCLILHPSALPKFRGGSPLQHQIMSGKKTSAVTICRATNKLDAGEIFTQTPFSLEGTLEDIFERIIEIGTKDTITILNILSSGEFITRVQDESQATTYKRRTPEQSELTLKDFKTKSAKSLNNFIRSLADPYPNAFIKIKGKKLYFTGSHL